MAKLAAIAALFIALIAGAAAYTATVTTTVMDNPTETCEWEMEQKPVQMTQCRQWLQKGSPFLRSAVANPGRYEEEQLQDCCDELRMFSPQCRCRALEMMQEQYGMEGETMMKKAESLPRRCQMTSPSRCTFRSPFY